MLVVKNKTVLNLEFICLFKKVGIGDSFFIKFFRDLIFEDELCWFGLEFDLQRERDEAFNKIIECYKNGDKVCEL